MEPEDGQILQDDLEGYDPAYEWPGDQSNGDDGQLDGREYSPASSASSKLAHGRPVFRFVALHSSILPSKHKIAILDSYSEVQIGRDAVISGSVIPRIRLKELEVSKLHATVYWDGARKEWNVVDMGSKHGTWLLHDRAQPIASSEGMNLGVRLSPPRVASIPRQLRHSDHLSIGGTTLVVHIHEDQRPCQDCTTFDSETEIPLFPSLKKSAVKRTRDTAGLDSDASFCSRTDRDPKKALTMLKRSLLTRHDVLKCGSNSTVTLDKSNEYVDRAALRRFLRPDTGSDAPGIPLASPIPSNLPCPSPSQDSTSCAVSQPPTPLPTSNIGHRLLMKQGWTPGDALGISDPLGDRVGLVEPLEAKSSQSRAGLGIKPPAAVSAPDLSGAGMTWKEREKMKRFAALR